VAWLGKNERTAMSDVPAGREPPDAPATKPKLQIGLSLTGMAQQLRGGDMEALLSQLVGWVQRARELGFDYIFAGQHYLTSPYQMLQPVPLLARLAQEAGNMRLVTTLLMPLHHPVALAENLASLDWISGGRLTVNVAQGYRREEFNAFGVTDRHVSSRMTECLRCVLALWSGEPVTFHGAHFRLQRAQIGLRPRQRPHPPIWFAASADRGVRRAARLGLPWHINPDADRTTLARQVELYRSEARDPEVPLPLAREVCCADSREEAQAMASRYLADAYAVYGGWGAGRATPGRQHPSKGFGDLSSGRFVIGSPSDCVQELRRYLDLGVGSLHVRLAWSGMPDVLARRSLELFAERVAPQLRAAAAR
jgi:alkanesulfonate monooxygenase SsuD/methylene tetrahydromethanopterin reductase-like flavin-dependent oxidoreductase (luciferase family)